MSIFKKGTTKEDKQTDKKQVKTAVIKTDKKVKVTADEKPNMKELYGTEEAVKNKKSKAGASKGRHFSESYRVLVKPLITEKASELGKFNKYAFEVDKTANKIMVARAIENIYGVKPVDVNVVNVIGKKKRTGRVFGRRKNWKKAIVTLAKGKTIEIYEGV